MRIYSESRLSPAAQQEYPPLGSVLIPRGASPAAMVNESLLNRVALPRVAIIT